ncbi:hypothetical protein OUZ56_029579 [Daphnia magna]|uniref:Uncharacterized protein n=1 Tax=Daphnia magna TaxID=35525 RepID=A0ABR0B7N3_9CRUS|nr:hypothetical protein OUZ56_029579 [Daphnia magna]
MSSWSWAPLEEFPGFPRVLQTLLQFLTSRVYYARQRDKDSADQSTKWTDNHQKVTNRSNLPLRARRNRIQEQNGEELNHPLDELRAAFEALLHIPLAVINVPDVGVQEDQMVEIEVVLAAGRGRGWPRGRGRPQVRGAPRREANEQLDIVNPAVENRRGRRELPRWHQDRATVPRQGAAVEGGPMGNPDALLNDRDVAGTRRQRVALPYPHLESKNSADEDIIVRIERFFEVENANFLQRRANVMAKLAQLQQLEQLEPAQQLEEINEDLPVVDVLQFLENNTFENQA